MTERYWGYTGRILRVDLTSGAISTEPLDLELAHKFVGGRGLGAKLLFDNLSPGTDPMSPENVLVFITGPLVGLPFFGAKHVVLTKSPLTGGFLDSYCGGHFASELKFAGFDGIIITGQAPEPCYLWVHNGKAELREAGDIWGKGCMQAEDMLKAAVKDERARVAVIGPAAENLVKFTHISTDYYHSCGRGGAGAVMGAKRLKAVVVRGAHSIRYADAGALCKFVCEEIEQRVLSDPNIANVVKYGKPLTMDYTNELGFCPTRNFQEGYFEAYTEIDGPAMRRKVVESDRGCFACNLPCGKFSRVKDGAFAGVCLVGPEYETNCLLGSNCGISYMEAIVQSNYLCDDLGLDVISAGNVIAFAMECYERGILTREDVGGLDLRFGNYRAVHEMIRMIAHRRGIGNLLAEGVKAAAQAIGRNCSDFAIQGKGLEFPGYDPRGVTGMALQYAVSDRGACHRRASPIRLERGMKRFTHEGRAQKFKELSDERIPMHCASMCDTVGGRYAKLTQKDFAFLFSAATGLDFSAEDIADLCDRVATLCLCFNLREGAPFTRQDNLSFWPRRMLEEPVPAGPAKGQVVSIPQLSIMLDEYYQLRGWDVKTGIPTRKTMARLRLEEEARQLAQVINVPEGD